MQIRPFNDGLDAYLVLINGLNPDSVKSSAYTECPDLDFYGERRRAKRRPATSPGRILATVPAAERTESAAVVAAAGVKTKPRGLFIARCR